MTKFEEHVLEEVKGPYEKKIAKIEMKAKKAEQANQNMIKLLLENGISAEVIEKANQVL